MEFKLIVVVLTLFILSFSPSPSNSKSLIFLGTEEDEGDAAGVDLAEEDDFAEGLLLDASRSGRHRRSPSPQLRNEDGDTVEEEDAERDIEEYEDEDDKPSSSSSTSTTTTTTTTTTTKPTTTASTTTAPATSSPAADTPSNSTPPTAAAGKPSNSSSQANPGPPSNAIPPPPPPNNSRPPPQNGTSPALPQRPPGPPPQRPPGRPPPGFPPGLPPGLLANLGLGPPKPTPKPPPANKGELYLPSHYNKLEIPKLDVGKPVGLHILVSVPVNVYLNIRSVRDWNEKDEEITLEMDLIVEWVDGVLFDKVTPIVVSGPGLVSQSSKPKKAPERKILSPEFLRKIWTPDIYIDNLIDVTSPKLVQKPKRLNFIAESGFISYYSRVAAKIKCDMDFYYYPADTQKCPIILKSYSYFDTDLQLGWLRKGVFLQETYDANFDLAVGDIEKFKIVQDFDNLKNESHDALKFTVFARRKLSYHIVQTYIPSIFFVIITWLCFMIPPKMVEARIAMAMTTLLTMTAMFSSVRDNTPVVSYVKAIDMWMVACIFFIFLTLLEFAVLVWFRSAREDEEEAQIEQQKQAEAGLTDLELKALKAARKKRNRQRPLSEKIGAFIEKFAFIIYSIIFIVFAVLYWTWLLNSAEYYSGWVVNSTYNNVDEGNEEL